MAIELKLTFTDLDYSAPESTLATELIGPGFTSLYLPYFFSPWPFCYSLFVISAPRKAIEEKKTGLTILLSMALLPVVLK